MGFWEWDMNLLYNKVFRILMSICPVVRHPTCLGLCFIYFFVLFFFTQGWSNFTVGASKFASVAKDSVSTFMMFHYQEMKILLWITHLHVVQHPLIFGTKILMRSLTFVLLSTNRPQNWPTKPLWRYVWAIECTLHSANGWCVLCVIYAALLFSHCCGC